MKIAQPFRAGVSGCAGASSPIGTTEANPSHANERVHFSRPDGTECTSRTSHPAMNRWAIFGCPFGTNRCQRANRQGWWAVPTLQALRGSKERCPECGKEFDAPAERTEC